MFMHCSKEKIFYRFVVVGCMLPLTLQVMKRSVKMLDLIYPYETYKIGVLYVGLGQVCDLNTI